MYTNGKMYNILLITIIINQQFFVMLKKFIYLYNVIFKVVHYKLLMFFTRMYLYDFAITK